VTACSVQSLAAGEPLAGTAPVAQCWIVIEQPGPWGRQALHDNRMEPNIGPVLAESISGTGTRVLLARHPQRRTLTGSRHVWIAHTAPGTSVLRTGEIADVREILDWDPAAMAAGSLPEFGRITAEPILFVCTHSGRDACCAIKGRDLVGELMSGLTPDRRLQVWECSHIGGHRFAPTALALPSGDVFGRLTATATMDVLAAEGSGSVSVEHYRGRSCFPAPMQVAEARVRAEGILDRDALDVLWVRGDRAIPVPPGGDLDGIASMLAEVRHADGRAWHVPVRQAPLQAPRAESCGGEQVEGHGWQAVDCTPTAPWR